MLSLNKTNRAQGSTLHTTFYKYGQREEATFLLHIHRLFEIT